MTEPAREPSMEDILASIKKVIAEEKELRGTVSSNLKPPTAPEPEDDILELDEVADATPWSEPAVAPIAPEPEPEPVDLGPPLVSETIAESSRQTLANLQQVAATSPAPQVNPLEAMVREMLRPILKDWLEKHLPDIVEEHVKREISRITGTPL